MAEWLMFTCRKAGEQHYTLIYCEGKCQSNCL